MHCLILILAPALRSTKQQPQLAGVKMNSSVLLRAPQLVSSRQIVRLLQISLVLEARTHSALTSQQFFQEVWTPFSSRGCVLPQTETQVQTALPPSTCRHSGHFLTVPLQNSDSQQALFPPQGTSVHVWRHSWLSHVASSIASL